MTPSLRNVQDSQQPILNDNSHRSEYHTAIL